MQRAGQDGCVGIFLFNKQGKDQVSAACPKVNFVIGHFEESHSFIVNGRILYET